MRSNSTHALWRNNVESCLSIATNIDESIEPYSVAISTTHQND